MASNGALTSLLVKSLSMPMKDSVHVLSDEVLFSRVVQIYRDVFCPLSSRSNNYFNLFFNFIFHSDVNSEKIVSH